MPETPGGLKIIGVVDVLRVIEIDDLMHGELVAVGFHQHRMRREGKSFLLQVHVAGHFTGSGQILFQEGGRHHQRFAGVVKARRVGRIDRKLAGRADVNARQIADRVVVLGIAETPRQHDAWVAGIAAGFVFADGMEPIDGRAPLLRHRMPRSLRRHLLRFETLQYLAPTAAVLH